MKGKIVKRALLKLSRKNIIKISDKTYLTWMGDIMLNQRLNIDNPTTFNEKMQYLKLYDRKEQYTKMVDKYEAKKYISEIIGKEYIIPTIGIYNNFEEINFKDLPNKFVIKTTHDSGSVIICRDKNNLDIDSTKIVINQSLNRNYYDLYKEWPYKNVKPRIIIEKYIDTGKKELNDYKFWCFNGEVKLIYFVQDREIKERKVDFYDTNWNKLNFEWDFPNSKRIVPKPKNLDKMLEIAEKLSNNIPFLRVDMYNIDGKIFVGELTFYTGAGFAKFSPNKYDYILGNMLELPKEKRVS